MSLEAVPGSTYPGPTLYPGATSPTLTPLYPGAASYPGSSQRPGGAGGGQVAAAMSSTSVLVANPAGRGGAIEMRAASLLSIRTRTEARTILFSRSTLRVARDVVRIAHTFQHVSTLIPRTSQGRGIRAFAELHSWSQFTASAAVVIKYKPKRDDPTFDTALRDSVQEVITRVELLVPGQPPVPLPVLGGVIELDAEATIRRRLSGLQIADPTMVPTEEDDLLQPLQNEVRISRGLRFWNGDWELHDLGIFGIYQTSVNDSSGVPQISVTGYDRSAAVRDNRWTAPWHITAGTDAAVAIRAIIANRFPGAEFLFPGSVGFALPNLLFGAASQNNPWKDATEIATAAAHELLVTPGGQFQLRPIANPDTQPPLWELLDGQGGTLTGINRQLTRERSYTRVIAEQEGTSVAQPLRSDVSIPSSRPRPYFYKATGVTTQAQLDTMAQALLRRYSGAFSTVNFEAIPDPRLDVGTVGMVRRADIGVVGKHVLETLRIPLSVKDGAMSGSLRGRNS